jgi:hypothetical protein
MNFIGKNSLNLHFYLYRSLRKMADKVQARVDKLKSSLFHFSLVKLLVVEELRNLNRDWDSFLSSTDIPLDPKRDTPFSVEILSPSSSCQKGESDADKGKGKEVEGSPPSHPFLKKGRNLLFANEPKETQTPRRPTTRSTSRRIDTPTMQTKHVEVSSQEMDEGQTKAGMKESEFREIQKKLREAHHVISHFYQESREMKRKLVERGPKKQTPQNKTYPIQEISKGKEVMHNPETTVLAKPTSPMTISSARKKRLETRGQHAAGENPPTLPIEGEKRIRWLNKKLSEAQDQVIKLGE